jgi:N-acetylglucosamine-6-phosphate deacetylase
VTTRRLGVDGIIDAGTWQRGDVAVEDGRVVEVGLPPAGTELVAARGFVDLQANGYVGVDLLTADEDAFREVALAMRQHGVQAWQATLITSPEAQLIQSLRTIASTPLERTCASLLGVHLEGPFLAPERLGTHPAEHRRDPDPAMLARLRSAGPVTYITLAPERPGALEMIDLLVADQVVVSLGHSAASAAQAHEAFDRGATTVTHLFNAMTSFTPRAPGIAGSALTRPDVTVQVIVDGHHLAPETVRLVFAAAASRVALVTDATAAAGLGDGSYRLGEVEVEVIDGAVRRSDGTLAGSALTMGDAVRNCVELGIDLPAAVTAATATPARIVREPHLAHLRPGAPADLVVIDGGGQLQRVLADGQEVTP